VVADVWDVDGNRPRTTLHGHTQDIRFLGTDAAGDKVMTFGQEGTVRIWQTATGKELTRLKGFDVPQGRVGPDNRAWAQGIRLSPDGRYAIIDQDPPLTRVHVYSAVTGDELPQLFREKDVDVIREIVFSADANLVFTRFQRKSADGPLLGVAFQGAVWDLATGRLLLSLPPFAANYSNWEYKAPALSPDGRRLFTHNDNEARIWDTTTGKETAQLKERWTGGIYQAVFSPDGKRLVTALGDGTARVWDVATGRPLLVLKGHEGVVVWSAAFSPDGRRIATGGIDRTARLYDAESGKEIATFRGAMNSVKEVRFAADGQWLFTRGDTEARLWSVDFLAEARQRKPRELTAAERERFEVDSGQR
jgi:WD40 repeat protein